jgi:hypothetical protein
MRASSKIVSGVVVSAGDPHAPGDVVRFLLVNVPHRCASSRTVVLIGLGWQLTATALRATGVVRTLQPPAFCR